MAIDIPGSQLYEIRTNKTQAHALCWKLDLAQATEVYYWTEWTLPLRLFDGKDYLPAYGAEGSAREEAGAVEPGTKEVSGFVAPGFTLGLTGDDIKRGALRGAILDEYLVDVRKPWVAPIDYKRYYVRGATFDGTKWTIEVEGLAYPLDEQVGEYWGPTCRAELFSSGRRGCNANLLDFIRHCEVSSIINQGYQFDIDLNGDTSLAENDYCTNGKVYWNFGNNGSGVYTIKEYIWPSPSLGPTHAEVRLQQRTLRDIAVGDSLSITPGCNHGIEQCRDRFDNAVNYQGEPVIPGADRATKGRPTPV